MKKFILAALATSTLMTATSQAGYMMQSQKAVELSGCLIARTTESQEQIIRDMLIAALQENKPAFDQAMAGFAFVVVSNLGNCGVSLEQVEQVYVEEAMALYGEAMGQRIMEKSLNKMMAGNNPAVVNLDLGFKHVRLTSETDPEGNYTVEVAFTNGFTTELLMNTDQ